MKRRILEIKAANPNYRLFVTNVVTGKQSSKTRIDQPAKSEYQGFAIFKRQVSVPDYLHNVARTEVEISKFPVCWSQGMAMGRSDFDFDENIESDLFAIKNFFKPGVKKIRTAKRMLKFLKQEGVDVLDVQAIPSIHEGDYDFYNGLKQTFIAQPAKSTPLYKVGNQLITSRFLQDQEPFEKAASYIKKKVVKLDKRQLLFGFNEEGIERAG